jgi:serine/threonine-protein kinase RsbW
MVDEIIELKLPADTKYVSIARMTASGIAAKMGFKTEAIEDIKVAISEACNNAVQYAYADKNGKAIQILFKFNLTALIITVSDQGVGFDPKSPPQRAITDTDIHLGMGLQFIQKLMDQVKITSQPGKGTSVQMRKLLV